MEDEIDNMVCGMGDETEPGHLMCGMMRGTDHLTCGIGAMGLAGTGLQEFASLREFVMAV
jgi:hypothetical protein